MSQYVPTRVVRINGHRYTHSGDLEVFTQYYGTGKRYWEPFFYFIHYDDEGNPEPIYTQAFYDYCMKHKDKLNLDEITPDRETIYELVHDMFPGGRIKAVKRKATLIRYTLWV